MNKYIRGFINNFTTGKLLVIEDKKLSLSTKFLQILVVCLLVTDLMVNELYQKTEVPSGYTSMWAESNALADYRNTSFEFCNNDNYNYIYANPDWRYTNISCVDLEYSEMYLKGENEIFYLTHFTENNINITNQDVNYISKKDYFTRGVEGMVLAFDHFYSTTFNEGGNVARRKIRTHIRDCNDEYDAYVFEPGETIKLTIAQWLELACVSLKDKNLGTTESLPDAQVPNLDYPTFRLTGIDMLIKIAYYNMKSVSGYDSEESIIKVLVNDGWSSKGSSINYIKYPDIGSDYTSHFVDRYKYGLKFKFLVSGIMGKFDTYNLVTHFVSGKVLFDICALIVIGVATTFFSNYSKKFNHERIEKIRQNGQRIEEEEPPQIDDDAIENITDYQDNLEQDNQDNQDNKDNLEQAEEQEDNQDKKALDSPKTPNSEASEEEQVRQIVLESEEPGSLKTSKV